LLLCYQVTETYRVERVIFEHFSKNRMIISVVAAKIWCLKNVRFLLVHPVVANVQTAVVTAEIQCC